MIICGCCSLFLLAVDDLWNDVYVSCHAGVFLCHIEYQSFSLHVLFSHGYVHSSAVHMTYAIQMTPMFCCSVSYLFHICVDVFSVIFNMCGYDHVVYVVVHVLCMVVACSLDVGGVSRWREVSALIRIGRL